MITKEKSFDLLSNSINYFFKEMHRDQFGELVCGYWDLRGEAKAFLSDARQLEVDFLLFWAVFLPKFAGKSSL